jgi:hypothetical protein
MSNVLKNQYFLDDSAKKIVDNSLVQLDGISDETVVDSVVSSQIRDFYFSIESHDQESGLINVLRRIAVQYVALLKKEQDTVNSVVHT